MNNSMFRDVNGVRQIDPYRIIDLYEITDGCLQAALIQILEAGSKPAGTNISKEVQSIINILDRKQEMLKEDDSYAQYIDSLDNSNISLEDLPVYPGINVTSKTC